jgi:Fic family protein
MSENYIERLRLLLRSGDLSQTELARRLDVTYAALNRWINGHAEPRPNKIAAINKLFQAVVGYPSVSEKEVLGKIKEAHGLKIIGLWDHIVRNRPLQEELLLEHTHNSTSIEGTTLTKRETESVLFNKALIPDKTLLEHLEVINHAAALRRLFAKEWNGKDMNEGTVKDIHKAVMAGIREDAGRFSTLQRVIRGVPLQLTHPDDIPEEMAGLLKKWNRRSQRTVREIAEFHAQFELIHPFGDGNGRVGRLLMVLQCLGEGYPPVVIENDRKKDYYDVLEYAQQKSDSPFILFLVEEMKKTRDLILKYIPKPQRRD